ncbi:valine--tRNA ligase [Haloferax sp. Atlit-47N]|uniref:Valine--tRNA ligase n=1 Tax=Haloferax sp. Atlit-48N TaxID=2077198 RepID=A0ACD5I0C2_9EURY|nr:MULTISPECIES: valine--tRNA ligase [unclassified Haloferax]RDZ29902.1 valine--tRNA ligase [Haloferax sp. Atlit-48N]RDZ41992.1 valine--tRNA ligase [Haloferax sp. Atlit-47N]
MPSGEYDPETVEAKWQERWVDEDLYAYPERAVDPDTVFSIDSPPPTVSGSLHWGHVYGFTLQDFVARFNRMRGDEVYFPFGYDDNGIASELLTEDQLGIKHQDYERREFQKLCREVTAEYESEFTEKMQNLGISIDWDQTYQTISPEVQRVSQLSFVDLYEKGRQYRQRAPAIWCPECETAISQVETEDDEQGSHFHDIEFGVADSEESFVISTTRPELLPACVAVFVHPDDDDNAHLVGQEAEIPLFGQRVPILEDERVDLETGTGLVMCCTFGDQTDIEWYQAHDLPLRVAIDESGTMTEEADDYAGLSADEAREAIVSDLDDAGALLDKRAITHTVNVHERCGTSVEFLVKDQWYIKLLDKREEYLEAGEQMDWYPEKMFTRYKNWIEGLQWDWAISRQRSSGIPFPVWYCEDCEHVVVADREDLPVDPLSDDPPVDACPECGHDEFAAEDDVFDTWATSSLTPLINAGWDWNPETEAMELDRPELYPFDMRPQGHDIISFWLFHTVVKCYEHTGEVPFDSVMINGMVLDENREKMSKSVGNVVSPDEVLEKFPVDAARYWAAGSAVGDDLPYQEKGLVAGEKLMRKLWNASKLVESLTEDAPAEFDHDDLKAIDRWLLASLDRELEFVTEKLENREFSKARDRLRSFFWHTFCDDYLEIAKQRVREGDDPSAAYTLQTAHKRFLACFAPILAHVTEELWRDMYDEASVHDQSWPEPLGLDADVAAGETAMAVVGALRKYKSDNQLSMNAPVDLVEVYGDIHGFEEDVSGVMHIEKLELLDEEPEIESVVTGVDLDYSLVGPEYGAQVPDIEAALEGDDYEVEDGVMHVAGVELDPEMFTIEESREYVGDGDMLEAGDAIVIVQHAD